MTVETAIKALAIAVVANLLADWIKGRVQR